MTIYPASVYLPETGLRYKPASAPPALPQMWRVLHDLELPSGNWRPGMPEVVRLVPDHHVVITEKLQHIWRDMNPHLTDEKFCKLFGWKLAFMNNKSGFPGHANYILDEELDKPDPRFDQARICGGAVVTGEVTGSYLTIETIDVRRPLPSVEYIMARRWLYFDAVLAGTTIRPFPQADGKPVYVPLLSAVDGVRLPLWKLQKLDMSKPIPSPYWMP